jgi:hypothetical protein
VGRHVKKNRSTKSLRPISITTVAVALTILAVGAVTVLSRQNLSTNPPAAINNQQNLHNATGQPLDSSSFDQLSQDNKEELAGGLKQMINQSTEGLTEVHHSDGSVSLNLEDRFQNVSVAKVTNGRLSQSCVDNPQAAGLFFNIDPKLIDNKPRSPVAPITK